MARPQGTEWNQHQLGRLLGTRGENFGRWINGVSYPSLQMLQKIDTVFGWPIHEQVKIIPFEGRDARYGMVLRTIVNEWVESVGPRDLSIDEIRSVAGHPGRRAPKRVTE